ncbi:uncharacterized protein LOC106670728 [Cimex lectularius]|uniref:Uncharacterized protein n=1 Tax=Cimex lectularius TaxID=79782 RepID=A0A8I6TGS0_CIMLE|nr:uncharacterized protein LOC106670728 [Cimex lectularius]
MFCNTECPEYQTPCVKHICQLQPPLPYLLYIMNIIGLIIYFIPNKGKSKYSSGPEESHIKTRVNEDIVYDRGKHQKRSVGKLEMDECEEEMDEPSMVKTKNKDFTKYKLGMSEKVNSYYKYDEEKSDGCSSVSYEKKSDEGSIISYEKKSDECSSYSYEKKSSDSSSFSYEKTGIECDESYIREKSYYASDDFRIQQTDECTESPRKQQFSYSYGEERKRKRLVKDKNKGRSELRKENCNKRPEMKIYIETGSNEYPPAFGDENKISRSSRPEPKVTIIKSPSVVLQESINIPNEKVESRKNSARSKASIVTHFSAQMNELDEQIKGKMEKLNSYSPQGEEERLTSIGRTGKLNSHISLHDEVVKIPSKCIISQLKPPFPSEDQDSDGVLEKGPSFVTTKKITIQSENSQTRYSRTFSPENSQTRYSRTFSPENSPTRYSRTISPEKDISTEELGNQREKTISSEDGNKRSVKSVNIQILEEVHQRPSDRPQTKFHPSVISPTESPTKLSFERPSATKKLSQKSSKTSVSVNSMILVDSLEALALTKLITNELNHAIKKEDTDKLSYCQKPSKDSVVQRSEVELLVMPRELLKLRKKIETKLNAIIREGGPKCAYIKELKKFFPYSSDNKAIFPCNINYGRSNKILCQRLFHRLLRKLRKKYDEVQKSNFLSKINAHVGGFVFVKRNDKNDQFQNIARQSNALENQSKVEKKREDLFVKKSNEGRRGNAYYQNYFERQRYKQHLCPEVVNKGESGRREDSEAKAVSDGKNKPTTSFNIKKELTQKGLKSSLVEEQTLQCDDGFSENEDNDYKVTSVIKKLYNNGHPTYHTSPTDDMSCAKRVLKLKVIAEDLKRIHSDLDENLQNLRKFIGERPHVIAQNAGDYVKELCKNGVNKELSRNVLKDRYTPLFSSKNPKFEDASTPKSAALSDFRQNTLIRKDFPQYSTSQNGRLSKANRYFAKTKPRSYKFKGNLHMKHIRDSKRKTTLKMLIWKHLFQEVMRETFKNSSVKTLLSVLNQNRAEKQRSGKRKKRKSIVNEKSSIPAKSPTTKTMKSSDDVIKPEPFAKPEEVKIKPSTSTSETFMIEEIEKCSNKYSESSQIKTSESAHSVLPYEGKNVKELNSNKLSEQEFKEVYTPLETTKVNSSVSKSTSITNSSQDKLGSNSLEDCSNGKDTKDSWTSVVSQEEKIDSDNRQELKRSLTEVLDLLIRPCPGRTGSQKDLSTFNSENSNENTTYLANDTYKMIDSIYSLTPKMISTGSQDDTGAITNMASWKNAFDIVLQYSASSKEINLVEEESIDDHLESDLL